MNWIAFVAFSIQCTPRHRHHRKVRHSDWWSVLKVNKTKHPTANWSPNRNVHGWHFFLLMTDLLYSPLLSLMSEMQTHQMRFSKEQLTSRLISMTVLRPIHRKLLFSFSIFQANLCVYYNKYIIQPLNYRRRCLLLYPAPLMFSSPPENSL